MEARLKEIGPDLQKVVEFNPNKVRVPMSIGRRFLRVRHYTDPATELIYTLVACQYCQYIESLIPEVEAFEQVQRDSLGWSTLVDLSLLDLTFYVLDPEKRFSPRRRKEVMRQLSIITGVLRDEEKAQAQTFADETRDELAYREDMECEDLPPASTDDSP